MWGKRGSRKHICWESGNTNNRRVSGRWQYFLPVSIVFCSHAIESQKPKRDKTFFPPLGGKNFFRKSDVPSYPFFLLLTYLYSYFQICRLLIPHCWSFTTRWWPSTTLLWSWFVANLTAAMYPCLVEKVWAVLPPATLERLFFVPATTVRIATTSMEWGRVSVWGREESKRGKGVGHGPVSYTHLTLPTILLV